MSGRFLWNVEWISDREKKVILDDDHLILESVASQLVESEHNIELLIAQRDQLTDTINLYKEELRKDILRYNRLVSVALSNIDLGINEGDLISNESGKNFGINYVEHLGYVDSDIEVIRITRSMVRVKFMENGEIVEKSISKYKFNDVYLQLLSDGEFNSFIRDREIDKIFKK